MEKGRWIIGAILLIGVYTVGGKKIEPLWDAVLHDPALGIIITVFFLLLILVIARIIRQ